MNKIVKKCDLRNKTGFFNRETWLFFYDLILSFFIPKSKIYIYMNIFRIIYQELHQVINKIRIQLDIKVSN